MRRGASERSGPRPRRARVRVCFVCLGNICRSPTAEGILRRLVREAGLEGEIAVESAGTGGYHLGESPDARAAATARERGVELSGRARRFRAEDFARFDHVVAMDAANRRDLLALAPDAAARAKVSLLRDFDPASGRGAPVPDPYYGGERGFDEVFDVCHAACRALLARLRGDPD